MTSGYRTRLAGINGVGRAFAQWRPGHSAADP